MIINHEPGDNMCLEGKCACRSKGEQMAESQRSTMAGPPTDGWRDEDDKLEAEARERLEARRAEARERTAELVKELREARGEVRTFSRTGGQKGVKPERYDLIPIRPLAELARHYARGAEKYDDHNWRKGYEWSKNYAAAMRHLTAFWNGEDVDPETGTPHVIAAAWHCFALEEFRHSHPDFDDRPGGSR